MNKTIEQLIEAAQKAKELAYAPYSGFKVGAAIVDESGNVHSGCNVENAAYPIGCCAEQSAVSQMILAGGSQIHTIVIIGGNDDTPCPPCGACRQIIYEHGKPETEVVLYAKGGRTQTHQVDELLPSVFKPDQLNN